MSAQELRTAAETLRAQAKSAPGGEWYAALARVPGDPEGDWIVDSPDRLIAGNIGIESDPAAEPRARYIATMHPGVGLALARWLDDVAAAWPWDHEPVLDYDGDVIKLEESMDSHALKIARLINGGAA